MSSASDTRSNVVTVAELLQHMRRLLPHYLKEEWGTFADCKVRVPSKIGKDGVLRYEDLTAENIEYNKETQTFFLG